MSTDANQWRRCSSCKTPIGFGAAYFVCNVSTCNRGTKGFVFCTVSCWDAHLGIVRHRESWAEDAKAPSRAEFAGGQTATPKAAPAKSTNPAKRESRRIIPNAQAARPAPVAGNDELPNDTLVVISKLKQYVKAKAGINCSDRIAGPLSDAVRRLCDEAIENALLDERKTLLDRDF